ncbi:uncharacterized protein BP5553_05440 [Venustampulla echinocandica]|uniref:Uncharacterized protein n=1 Tax=Venustampulla echinocandica TaxID=2656787 RepID=A0A370TR60_9HELO|nr:uncharacterized protein BP5553_05440 [Venustampulla echinocandica]RDL38007.1 hypothetical protein BP5553_05440 [Venustampulla echinocandica]
MHAFGRFGCLMAAFDIAYAVWTVRMQAARAGILELSALNCHRLAAIQTRGILLSACIWCLDAAAAGVTAGTSCWPPEPRRWVRSIGSWNLDSGVPHRDGFAHTLLYEGDRSPARCVVRSIEPSECVHEDHQDRAVPGDVEESSKIPILQVELWRNRFEAVGWRDGSDAQCLLPSHRPGKTPCAAKLAHITTHSTQEHTEHTERADMPDPARPNVGETIIARLFTRALRTPSVNSGLASPGGRRKAEGSGAKSNGEDLRYTNSNLADEVVETSGRRDYG